MSGGAARKIVPRLFFNFSEKAVQLRRIIQGDQALDLLASIIHLTCLVESQSQIVTVIVGCRIGVLSVFEERNGAGNLTGLDIKLT